MVTEAEKEHVMNGSLEELVEQQKRIDQEKDALVSDGGCLEVRGWASGEWKCLDGKNGKGEMTGRDLKGRMMVIRR